MNRDYEKAFGGDDESLRMFLGALARFDRAFCNVMATGVDYTLKLEVHGAGGKIIHVRVSPDEFHRPKGAPVPKRKS